MNSPGMSFDPILISLIKRSMPTMRLAEDICKIQPMSGPTGLIFSMKSKTRIVEDVPIPVVWEDIAPKMYKKIQP